jgi:6-pyruvoyltetrahydropterin/6-carboxytetrahydropterin synthase
MDFGGLKAFKEWSEHMFDHTLCIAEDDPFLNEFKRLANFGNIINSGECSIANVKPHERGALCVLRIVPAVGCEKFSEFAFNTMSDILATYQRGEAWSYVDAQGNTKTFENRYPVGQGVKLRSVEVFEHGANSGSYEA